MIKEQKRELEIIETMEMLKGIGDICMQLSSSTDLVMTNSSMYLIGRLICDFCEDELSLGNLLPTEE